MTNIVIMIAGKSNSGKGTVADFIIKNSNSKYNKIKSSLSTYIRDVAKNDFYWDGIETDTSREFMGEVYRLGTKLYPYHMARRVWERDNRPYLSSTKDNLIVVESLREKNNYDYYEMLLNQGFIDKIITLRVNRTNFSPLKDEERKNHVSEIDMDDFNFDYYIDNNGDFEALENQIIKFCQIYLEGINE